MHVQLCATPLCISLNPQDTVKKTVTFILLLMWFLYDVPLIDTLKKNEME